MPRSCQLAIIIMSVDVDDGAISSTKGTVYARVPTWQSSLPFSFPPFAWTDDPITADLTAHLDHTSDEFKTIIQEHYRRTLSLRKLADIHGVSRSTVHRIVKAQ